MGTVEQSDEATCETIGYDSQPEGGVRSAAKRRRGPEVRRKAVMDGQAV
jgi:hypothetical protein